MVSIDILNMYQQVLSFLLAGWGISKLYARYSNPRMFFDGRNSVADGKPLMSPLLYSKMEGIRRPLINVPELQK